MRVQLNIGSDDGSQYIVSKQVASEYDDPATGEHVVVLYLNTREFAKALMPEMVKQIKSATGLRS